MDLPVADPVEAIAPDAVAPEAVKLDANGTPPRPQPNPETLKWVDRWWEETDNVPEHSLACEIYKKCKQALFPGWWDPKDPWAGRKPRKERTREDDRRVNSPLIYFNNQQTIAQFIPENHEIRWRRKKRSDGTMGGNPNLKKFAASVETVSKQYMDEINWQDLIELWLQYATDTPMGIIKVHYERDFLNEPTKSATEQDGQDNLARAKQILGMLARGEIHQHDRQVVELGKLLAAQGQTGEIEVREGLVAEPVPLPFFGWDPKVPNLRGIYQGRWMYHDNFMTKKTIGQRYEYRQAEDGTWTGIHPEDLRACQPQHNRGVRTREFYTSQRSKEGLATRPEPAQRGSTSKDASDDEDVELLVREVWDRESGMVYVLLEGVGYAIAEWKNDRPGPQWFPFHCLALNPMVDQVVGVCDTELQEEDALRINRKRSDAELARWLGLPRGVYDSSSMDESEAAKLKEIQPGQYGGLKLAGEGNITQRVAMFAFPFHADLFDTFADHQDLQRAAALPEQARGVTGGAKFAREVDAAMQGAAISSKMRGNRFLRSYQRLLSEVAAILLQEVTPEAAKEIDETVYWPTVYSDKEAAALYDQIFQEQAGRVLPQVLAPYMGGMTDPSINADPMALPVQPQEMPPMEEVQRMIQEAAAPLVEAACMEKFGMPRPLSRESLFRQLYCHVKIDIDGQLDRAQRLEGVSRMAESISRLLLAAREGGVLVDAIPLFRQLAKLAGVDDDLEESMFNPDPNAAAQVVLQTMQAGEMIDPELAAALFDLLQQQAAAAQAQAAADPAGAVGAAAEPPAAPPAGP